MLEENISHKLLFLIKKNGEIRHDDAAKLLKLDEDSVMTIANILSQYKIVEIFYAVSGDTILKPGKEFKKAFDDILESKDSIFKFKKLENNMPNESHYVDNFLSNVRKEIANKKRGGESSQ